MLVACAGVSVACGASPATKAASAPTLIVARADEVDEPAEPPVQPRTEPPPPNPFPLGRWAGTGVQGDGQSWPLEVDLWTTRSGACASVRYPSIPCAATWICVAQSSDGVLEAREELTEGHDRCIDGGTMTMRPVDDHLEWQWQGSGQTARADLTRVK